MTRRSAAVALATVGFVVMLGSGLVPHWSSWYPPELAFLGTPDAEWLLPWAAQVAAGVWASAAAASVVAAVVGRSSGWRLIGLVCASVAVAAAAAEMALISVVVESWRSQSFEAASRPGAPLLLTAGVLVLAGASIAEA